jgi:hypothetical protein
MAAALEIANVQINAIRAGAVALSDTNDIEKTDPTCT